MKLVVLALAGLFAGGGVAAFAETDVATRLDAGLWEVSSTITSGNPALPQPPIVVRRCLTSEEAVKGVEAMLTTRPGCTVTHSTMNDGKLDALLQCGIAGTDRGTTIAIKGSFEPKSYQAVSEITQGVGGIPMSVRVAAKWVGPCSS